MNEAVTDVIVMRSRERDRLSTMLVWSIAGHIAVSALIALAPEPEAPPARTVMTISLGGAAGPRTGGLTQMGGRAVQAPKPEEPVRRAETAPAPTPPKMTLPDPKARVQPRTPPKQAPKEATGKTPTTGAEPREGSTRAETQVRGQGFGLSTAGGAGGGVTLDVSDFCCPEYISDMILRVRQNWQQSRGIVGITTMRFTITRDGTITAIQRERSSGFEVLDLQAERALRLTARLAPLPAQFPNQTLTVYMQFDYGG
jgi:protein TonB